MKQPLVSIITPCYNSEKFIIATLNSVQNQTYTNWEMLITDDGSTDGSIKIIEEYIAKDNRIKLFRINNSGPAVARNFSIKNAQGTFVAFLDSDDLWLPEKLKKQIHFMLHHDYEFTFTSYQRMNEEGDLKEGKVKARPKICYRDMLSSNKLGCLTVIYNQEKIGKQYMPLIRKRQDYGLWLAILKQVPFAYGLDEVLASYRVRNISISAKKTEMLKWNWKLFREIEKKNIISASYWLICNIYLKILRK